MKRILSLCLSFLMILTCLSAVAEGAQFQIPLKQKTEIPVRKRAMIRKSEYIKA